MASLPALLAAAVVAHLGGVAVAAPTAAASLNVPLAEAPIEIARRPTQPSAQATQRSGILTTRFSGSWVNIRRQPSLRSPVEADGRSGSRVTILQQTRGTDDNFQWYLVELAGGERGWVRGDLIREEGSQRNARQAAHIESPHQAAHVSQASQLPAQSSRQAVNISQAHQSTAQSPRQATPVGAVSQPTAPSRQADSPIQAVQTSRLPSPPVAQPSARDRGQAGPATGGNLPRVSVSQRSPHARGTSPAWSRSVPEAATPVAMAVSRPVVEEVSESRQAVAPTITPMTAPTGYTAEEIDYFKEIALGSEFGNASPRIRKWRGPVNIRVHGTPTRADEAALAQIVQDLNRLLGQSTRDQVSVNVLAANDTRQANVDMYFVPHSEFSRYEPNYRAGNLGFAYVNWRNNEIYKARILVTSTNDITPTERAHLIREELTQSLGLLRDSMRYRDSIFYQGWTGTTRYTDLDEAVIEMLYNPAIQPGMDGTQVETALRNLSPVLVGGRSQR
ncbi:MAG: DUF2927 domain-containing protein [Cyanobacteria bacterium P01_A01_bin.135]